MDPEDFELEVEFTPSYPESEVNRLVDWCEDGKITPKEMHRRARIVNALFHDNPGSYLRH